MNKTLLTVSMLGASMLSSQAATTFFTAGFNGSLDGFTASTDANGVITQEATYVAISRDEDGGTANSTNTLTRTIDTTGFTSISVAFDLAQLATGTWEGNENVTVSVDSGSGFVEIFSQDGGLDGSPSDGSIQSYGPLALDAAADNGSFDIRFSFSSGFAGPSATGKEEYQLHNLEVTGVPEPSSTALLGLGGLALILRRRR